MDLSTYLSFAEATAREAGALTLKYFQTTEAKPEYKSDDTPVTIADQEAEQLIRSRIEVEYPDHQVVGEEYGESTGDDETSSYRWIIDPIDGTKSFVCGVPLYAVLIALEIEGKVEAGCAYFPALDEMVSGATGIGAFWNGKPCRVSETGKLDRAICAHIDTAYIDRAGKGDAWKRLQQAVYYNAGWCDAYGYLLVATGRVDIMVDPVMALWDCGPFPPILNAVVRWIEGEEPADIIRSIGFCEITIYKWIDLYNEGGFDALYSTKTPGAKSKLNVDQEA